MKKRILTALLALCLLTGGLPAAAADGFDQRARAAAEHLYCLGLLDGAGTLADGTPDFNLGGQMTRGQAITMNENKHDFYFAMRDMVPMGDTFDYLISNVDQLCLTLPKGHPMARGPLDFSRLKDERFISISEAEGPALYSQIQKVCQAMEYEPRITNRYDTAETVLLAVGAGLGISILPQAITKVFFSDNVEAIPIQGLECAGRTYVVAWHRQSVNPTAALFLDVVREVLSLPEEGR